MTVNPDLAAITRVVVEEQYFLIVLCGQHWGCPDTTVHGFLVHIDDFVLLIVFHRREGEIAFDVAIAHVLVELNQLANGIVGSGTVDTPDIVLIRLTSFIVSKTGLNSVNQVVGVVIRRL